MGQENYTVTRGDVTSPGLSYRVTATREAPVLSKIGQISIIVKDVERATAYYRDVLGLKFLFAAPNLAFFDAAGTWLMLGLPEGEFTSASILYFDVDDIAGEHRTLKGKGVEFRTEPHVVHRDGSRELWLADFRDGEGNTFCLRQWRQA
jgi:methylmalonyl-CoA/ethylmalonyl-CoA epimerase